MAKETPGDGSMLTPLRKGQALYRSMFGIEHDGVRYDVDVNFFDWDEKVLLYRNGIQDRVQRGKLRFELPDESQIEVVLRYYGVRRDNLFLSDDCDQQLEKSHGYGERLLSDIAC